MYIRRIGVGVLAATVALGLGVAGCSSPGDAGDSSNNNTGGGNADAQAAIKQYLSPPTEIPIGPALNKCPDSNKTIIITQGPEPTSIRSTEDTAAAAKLLGWKTSFVRWGTGADGAQTALDAALDEKPDGIIHFGSPASLIQGQLDRATKLGIPVVLSDNGGQQGVKGTTYQTNAQGDNMTGKWGDVLSTYLAAKGSKKALVVDLALYPVLHAFTVQSEATLTKYGVKSAVLNSTVDDLVGGKLPAKIVSEVQRDPDIDWVLLSLPDMATGLTAALAAAGLADKVKIGGEGGATANLDALKKGNEDAWTAFPTAIAGAYRIDAMARVLDGQDPTKVNYDTPTQLLVPDNIANAPVASDGYYVGIPNYADFFTKLWKGAC